MDLIQQARVFNPVVMINPNPSLTNFERIALRKLRQLQVAEKLSDLKVPPGNKLEPLKGKRKGQYSIRIND